ncbi:MAG TPA: hypothetical protein VJ855_01975 [Marinilabiliaceae bacterium]|nr:hypothetical protein [Marinilabiliaceae bacterium]
MKKEELPQDRSALQGYTRELHYVKNEEGKFTTGLSSGWEVKASALENAWEDVHEQMDEAKELVVKGEKSPLYFLMIKNLMDISILSSYTGFWKIRLRRHFKPSVYKNLSDNVLLKYAEAFSMTLNEIKEFEV